ncbi:MAG: methyltransferase domain-containing protein [Nitrospinaceae bacterium]
MNERRACCETETGEGVSRDHVRNFYSQAAVSTQESLCCPTQYNDADLSHIPSEVRKISYGCGSPINRAQIREGEVVVDLGSGGGIDCFIAAKFAGRTGRVIGIDMTDEMVGIARKNQRPVAENLGFDNVEFKMGFLENIPLQDQSANLVTSNCVVNLSVDKHEVFREIHRILKPGGRFVIADIISEKKVPEEMRNQQELWGECVSGALTLNEFLDAAQPAGFHGFQIKKDYLWKEVQGIKFYSYTLEAYKSPVSESSCCSLETSEPPDSETPSCCGSFTATYAGPFTAVTHQERTYPLGVPVEVDEATAELLRTHPYAGHFIVGHPDEDSPAESSSCCG